MLMVYVYVDVDGGDDDGAGEENIVVGSCGLWLTYR